MTTNCENIFLNKDIEKLMSDIIDKSENNNVEMGFGICSNSKLTVTKICTGNFCSINIGAKCPSGTHKIADFHTHPSKWGTRNPTDIDINSAVFSKLKTTCIGGKEELNQKYINKVECYDHPFGIRENKITEYHKSYNEYDLKYKEFNSNSKKLKEKYKKLQENRSEQNINAFDKANKEFNLKSIELDEKYEKYIISRKYIKKLSMLRFKSLKPSCEEIVN